MITTTQNVNLHGVSSIIENVSRLLCNLPIHKHDRLVLLILAIITIHREAHQVLKTQFPNYYALCHVANKVFQHVIGVIAILFEHLLTSILCDYFSHYDVNRHMYIKFPILCLGNFWTMFAKNTKIKLTC